MTKNTTLSALYAYLKRFHLSDSLILIGAVNSALKYNNKDFFTDHMDKSVILWLQKHCKTDRNYASIQIACSRLARYMILSGANDHRDKALSLDDQSFALALDRSGEIYEPTVERELLPRGGTHLLARLLQQQLQLQSNQMLKLGRAALLFLDLPEKTYPSYSFEDKMIAYFGISTYAFLSTGLTIWIKTDGYEKDLLTIEIPGMVDVATDQNQRTFLGLSSGDPEGYRKLVRGEDWKTKNELADIYAPEPFLTIPAIRIGRSARYKTGSYVIPQPYFFYERAANGIFYLLADKEQELAKQRGNKDENPFRVAFGHVYRQYVKLQFAQDTKNYSFVDLDDDFINTNGGKIPDFALIKDSTCIVVEVKTSLLNIHARSYFEPVTLREEIKKGSFNKAIRQVNDFSKAVIESRISDPRFQNINRVIKIIAGYEDIYLLNAILLPLLREQYGAMAEDLQLASVSDIDQIGTVVSEGKDIVGMIRQKTDHKDTLHHPFLTDLQDKVSTINPILQKSFDELFDRMSGITPD